MSERAKLIGYSSRLTFSSLDFWPGVSTAVSNRTSSSNLFFNPAFSPRAIVSARACIPRPSRVLTTSFIVVPMPLAPIWNLFLPRMSKIGSHCLKVVCSPPTKITRLPWSTCGTLPDTIASIIGTFLSFAASKRRCERNRSQIDHYRTTIYSGKCPIRTEHDFFLGSHPSRRSSQSGSLQLGLSPCAPCRWIQCLVSFGRLPYLSQYELFCLFDACERRIWFPMDWWWKVVPFKSLDTICRDLDESLSVDREMYLIQ